MPVRPGAHPFTLQESYNQINQTFVFLLGPCPYLVDDFIPVRLAGGLIEVDKPDTDYLTVFLHKA